MIRTLVILLTFTGLLAANSLEAQPLHSPNKSFETIRDRALELRARAMFHQIQRHVGPAAKNMRFRIVRDNEINAYVTNYGVITIYTGMLRFTADYPNQIAHVIAHEIAHHMLGHTTYRSPYCRVSSKGSRQCENEADQVGMIYIRELGYNQCRASEIWLRFFFRWGNVGGTTHPKMLDRYEALRCR